MVNNQPQLKCCFRYQIVPSEGVFLLSEKGDSILRGPIYVHLIPFLNGQYTESEIIQNLTGKISAPEIYYGLERLRSKGYVRDICPEIPAEQAAFWDTLDVRPDEAAQRLHDISVSLVTFGQVNVMPLQLMLEKLGINVTDNGDFSVVLTDDYLHKDLDTFNQDALAGNHPWLLAKPIGTTLWIGPIFVPLQTGCWFCLAHRLEGHRKLERYLERKAVISDSFSTPSSSIPSTVQTASGLIATEIAKWLASSEYSPLLGRVLTLDLVSLEKKDHVLVQRPQCPICGDLTALALKQSAPIKLQSQKKILYR